MHDIDINDVYEFLQSIINFQIENNTKRFFTYTGLFNELNEYFDINIPFETWRKRRERLNKFKQLTNEILDFTPIVEEVKPTAKDQLLKLAESFNASKTVKFSGNTFTTLNTNEIIDKVKTVYKQTKKEFALNYLKVVNSGPICIVALGDTHIGKGLNIEKLLEDLEIIANTDGMYVLLLGDYADNFVNGAWCMNLALIESITPREQNALTDFIIGKIAHKVIGILTGNHNEWGTIGDWNPLMNILEKYDYSGFYGTNRLDIELHYISGNNEYVKHIRLMHNWPGRSITNVTYGIEKACKTSSFDIGIAAHTHEGALYREFVHEGTKRVAAKVGSYKVDDYAYNLGYSNNGMLNNEAVVPIIIMPDGNVGTAPNLKYAAKLLND